MNGLFITGSDTGVGKTLVGAALAAQLAHRGLRMRVRKPVESGCPETASGRFPVDAATLAEAAGLGEHWTQVCPWPLAAPLSPERAAALEGLTLDLAALTGACRAGVNDQDWLLVEGAGGFLSPLAPGIRNAELAAALRLPILLVVANRLGCLNHAQLTVEAITARNLPLAGVVLNHLSPDERIDNQADLARWLHQPVFSVPCISPPHWQCLSSELNGLFVEKILTFPA